MSRISTLSTEFLGAGFSFYSSERPETEIKTQIMNAGTIIAIIVAITTAVVVGFYVTQRTKKPDDKE